MSRDVDTVIKLRVWFLLLNETQQDHCFLSFIRTFQNFIEFLHDGLLPNYIIFRIRDWERERERKRERHFNFLIRFAYTKSQVLVWHLFIKIMKYSLLSRFLWISNNPNTDRQKRNTGKNINGVVRVRLMRRISRGKNIKTAKSSACQVSLYWSCRATSKIVHN